MKYVLRQTLERDVKLKTGAPFRVPPFPGEPLPPRLDVEMDSGRSSPPTPLEDLNISEPCLPETTLFSEHLKTKVMFPRKWTKLKKRDREVFAL